MCISPVWGDAKLRDAGVSKASGEKLGRDDDRLSFLPPKYAVPPALSWLWGGGGLNLDRRRCHAGVSVGPAVTRMPASTPSQMKENLEKLWDEVKVLTEPQAVAPSLEPFQGPGELLLAMPNIFGESPAS